MRAYMYINIYIFIMNTRSLYTKLKSHKSNRLEGILFLLKEHDKSEADNLKIIQTYIMR